MAEEPEPIRLWGQTWIEFTTWGEVTIAPYSASECVLTWPILHEYRAFQSGVFSNIDLAGLLFP